MSDFCISSQPQNFCIGTDNPSPFELGVFNEVVQSLNVRPSNPFTSPNTSQAILKLYAIADLPTSADPDEQEAFIAWKVWGIFIHIAKQIDVRAEKQSMLATLFWELNQLDCEELARHGLERNPPSIKDMLSPEACILNSGTSAHMETELLVARERLLNVCAFLGHLSFKRLLLDYTAALAVPCMDLVREPPREDVHDFLLLPSKELARNFDKLTEPQKTVVLDWIDRVHVSALWIHARGREWFSDTRPVPDRFYDQDLSSFLPPPLNYQAYKSRGELWATWRQSYKEIIEKCSIPMITAVADDVDTRMQMVQDAANIIAHTLEDTQEANNNVAGMDV